MFGNMQTESVANLLFNEEDMCTPAIEKKDPNDEIQRRRNEKMKDVFES
jgi:hypothetical protein